MTFAIWSRNGIGANFNFFNDGRFASFNQSNLMFRGVTFSDPHRFAVCVHQL